jgi:peptide/nickel transport system permease protein
MAATAGSAAGVELPRVRPLRRGLRSVRRYPVLAGGGTVLVVLVVLALVGPGLLPHSAGALNVEAILQSPGTEHWFGTDELGRDLLARTVLGIRYSLIVSMVSVAAMILIATTLGMTAGFFPGTYLDSAIMRLVDAMLALPYLVVVIVVVGSLGSSLSTVIIALAIGLSAPAVRVIRSATIAQGGLGYVLSAQAIGASTPRILARHILPNIVSVLLIVASAAMGFAILAESALSFLGLGPPPETATLGRILAVSGQRYWDTAPWLGVLPGGVLVVLVLAVNLVGDAVRDILDPRP